MSYRALGQEAPTRPTWCPSTSLRPGQRDPCEIEYAFDLPLVGKTTFGLPIPAITNDALITAQRQLPGLLDQSLPIVYSKLQPYIDDLTDFVIPRTVDKLMREEVQPLIEVEREKIIAEADTVVQKALLGVGIITAAGLGAWWFLRKR